MPDAEPTNEKPVEFGPEPAASDAAERRRKRLPARDAREVGGVDGPEPTRYGDWERNGRCTDF